MAGGIVLSQRDADRLRDMLRWFEHTGRNIPLQRRRNISVSSGTNIWIFEVQSQATGDGVYNCYKQKLDATDWTDTSGVDKFDDKEETPVAVEVLNLLESDTESTYQPALAKYDLIVAWHIKDDEGNTRWVGIPVINDSRRAITTQAAPAATYITANLYDRHGAGDNKRARLRNKCLLQNCGRWQPQ